MLLEVTCLSLAVSTQGGGDYNSTSHPVEVVQALCYKGAWKEQVLFHCTASLCEAEHINVQMALSCCEYVFLVSKGTSHVEHGHQ